MVDVKILIVIKLSNTGIQRIYAGFWRGIRIWFFSFHLSFFCLSLSVSLSPLPRSWWIAEYSERVTIFFSLGGIKLWSWRFALKQSFPICALHIPMGLRPFTRDPWIHFCNSYFKVYLFSNERNNVLLKIIAELL